MHEHHPTGHIPPPDAPRKKSYLGLRPHHWAGGLFLIALLIVFLLLLAKRGV